jgi:hypothetical protein
MKRGPIDDWLRPTPAPKKRRVMRCPWRELLTRDDRAAVRSHLYTAPDVWALAAVSRVDWGERDRRYVLGMRYWGRSPILFDAHVGRCVMTRGCEAYIARGSWWKQPDPHYEQLSARAYGFIDGLTDRMDINVCWTHSAASRFRPCTRSTMHGNDIVGFEAPRSLIEDIREQAKRCVAFSQGQAAFTLELAECGWEFDGRVDMSLRGKQWWAAWRGAAVTGYLFPDGHMLIETPTETERYDAPDFRAVAERLVELDALLGNES